MTPPVPEGSYGTVALESKPRHTRSWRTRSLTEHEELLRDVLLTLMELDDTSMIDEVTLAMLERLSWEQLASLHRHLTITLTESQNPETDQVRHA